MFDHVLRALKDRWLAPVARWLGPAVSPNLVTMLAFLVGMASAAAVLVGHDGVALAFWVGNRVLDGLDGTVARINDRQTDFGGYLDIVLDFVVYAAIPVAMLAAPDGERLLLPGAILLASFFVNAASWMYLAAILERRSAGASARGELTTVTMPPGIVAGTETFAFYAVFIVAPGWRATGFMVMSALVGVNVLQRLWWGHRALR